MCTALDFAAQPPCQHMFVKDTPIACDAEAAPLRKLCDVHFSPSGARTLRKAHAEWSHPSRTAEELVQVAVSLARRQKDTSVGIVRRALSKDSCWTCCHVLMSSDSPGIPRIGMLMRFCEDETALPFALRKRINMVVVVSSTSVRRRWSGDQYQSEPLWKN